MFVRKDMLLKYIEKSKNNSMLQIFKNIQFQQTLILSSILSVGIVFFKLDISYLEVLAVFITVISLDFLLLNFYSDKKKTQGLLFPFSGVNAAFWICFFLRSFDLAIYIFAASIAILWKHIIVAHWKHFFNPSNMAVCFSLLLFPQYTWLNTLQWWNYTWEIGLSYIIMLIAVISFWMFMMFRVYKDFKFFYILDLIAPFLIFHFLLFFIIPFNESLSSFLLFFNVSFFIFTFFMLTDPKTVPKTSYGRVVFSISTVLSFYILQFHINEAYAILFALFFNTILLSIIWYVEKNKKVYFLFAFLLLLIEILLIIVSVSWYGYPDLVFDNVCNQLICK